MLPLPNDFIQRIIGVFGDPGSAWLERLPTLIDECTQRWSLKLESPYEPLTYSYTAPGICSDGSQVVLKLTVPNRELTTEMEALRIFAGHGSARLLDADPAVGALLLERIHPGQPLDNIEDDERATAIAIDVMQSLWQPVPPDHSFPTTADWGNGLQRLRNLFNGGSGPFPEELVYRAETTFTELSQSSSKPVLLHGDLHHWNILSSDRGSWLSIDPKGVIGEPAYETGAFLRNPFPNLLKQADNKHIIRKRVDQFSQGLEVDPQRITGWAFSQAVLAGWWSYEDKGQDWVKWLEVAELFL